MTTKQPILPTEVRDAIEKILDHYMPAEERHYFEYDERPTSHIFHLLSAVGQWLDSE